MPVSFQVNILKKIFVADKIIKSKADGFVLIVHDETTTERASLISKSFNSLGVKTKLTTSIESHEGENISAIYYLTDVIVRPSYIAAQRILTIAGSSEYVTNGESAIGMKYDNGFPVIVINRLVIENEGHKALISMIPKAEII